ncbi:uncharacterized protein LOC118797675 [Colossoma macropomum]|uniref:uncharacterized protein LOC118797675 n=1 Tax=Colossoma macropomum TaxID=42526 RepID=UPI0018652773|nr:uncharacterized protein LOC118797675 [Colossoma macropomum]
MRGNISSNRALILSALWIGCWSVLVRAQCNSTTGNATSGPDTCSTANSDNTTINGSITITATATVPMNSCQGVNSSGQLDSVMAQLWSGNVSAVLCNFSIPEFACASFANLSSDDLVILLTCKLRSGEIYSKEIWELFVQRFSASLDGALDKYYNETPHFRLPSPSILDGISVIKVNNFSDVELKDVAFITTWFQIRLRPFLASASTDFLSSLSSKNFSCQTYQVVVQAFSIQETLLEKEQKHSIIDSFIEPFLSKSNLADPRCISNVSGSREWLTKNFGNFSTYATLKQLQDLNENFSRFESLDLLTPSQAAELTLSSGALNSTSQIDLVFNQLQKGDAFTNVHDFLTVLSDQKAPVINPAVRDVMMNRTFKIISMKFSQFQTYDWYDWFKVKLISLLPSFTAEMLTNATLGINCTNYHVIVDALSTVAVNMPVNRNQELGAVLVAYLKQSIQQINQTGCRVNNQTDADWLTVNLGHFSSYLSFSQLAQFNISWFGSLDLLTPSQAAELTLSSGALNSTSQIDLVFNQLQKGDAFMNVHDFLTVLSDQKAPVINPAVRDVMMNRTFKIISMRFSQFQTYDWYDWFKVKLISLLPSFTAEMLTNATLGINCTNYHVIVDALSTVAVNMPVNRNQELGAVLVAYLKQSIQQINQTGCRVNNQTDVDWLTVNLGHFSSYLSFSQLAQFNISWFGSLDLLTPSQAAELTLSSGALNSTSQIDLVFNQLQKGDAFTNVHDFLTVLSDQKAPVINPAVRDVMMNRTFKIISMRFSQFQTYDWYDWFKVKLISLLPSFTAEMLTNATLGISCTNYHVIVDALSTVAVNMPVNRNQELGAVLVAYLKQSIQQINQTGCRVNNQTDADWLTVNLGHFSSYLSFSQLAQFNISWFGSLDLLTPSQAAELTLSSGALNSTSQIDLVFNQLQKGDAFMNVHDFLTVLSDQKAPVINPAVRDVMMNRTFKIISMRFSQFQTYDWYDWFKVKLISLLPSFTAEMLTNATLGISCTNYQVIVDALSTVAVNMPVNRNQELGAVLVAYLKQSIQQINQTGCRVNNQTDADWFTVNLGHFSSYLSFSQLAQFNISWFGSLDLLTPSQAAELTLSSGALNSTSQIDLVFNQLQKGDAFTNVHDFLTVLSDQKAPVINPAVRDVMMNRTFKIISMKFSQFQTYDWYDWFKVKLISLLPSFTAEMLTNATLGINCTNYHVIVDALSTVAVNMPVNRNQELGAVLVAYLKQSIQQINQTGCRVNNQTDVDWLTVNLGHFSSYLSFSQLAQFNISWFGSLDLLTPSQAAELTLSSGALNSTSQIDLVFNQLQKGDAFTNVHDFLTVLSDQKAPVINPAVRDVMMNRTFKIISMKFSQFQTYDWYDWFKVKLISLLPSFTAEMLTNATLGISCTNYQVIVDALSTVAVNMPVNRNQELGVVLVAYLKQSIQQINQTGCRVNNQTDADWFTVNLGHFSSYLSFSQLAQFNISWFGSLDLLTPSQAAELTLSSGALNSTSQIDLVFNQLQKGDAFTNVHDFLTVLSDQKAPVINPAVRDVMMNRTFKIISMKFSQFQTYDWYDWFKVKLISLLPSFTAEMLTNATLGISCTNYQVIVDALSTVAVNMPVNRNQELGVVLVAYLKQSIQQINQTGCRVNNQTDADWFTVNLGHFSSYLSFSQLAQFNISWFGSLDLLTPSQAAELTLSSGALNSTSQIDLVFNQLQKGDAFTNVHDFLTVLSDQKAPVINPAVRDVMMNRTFKIISMKFSQFQTYDWYDWFKVKLISLLPSFTAEMLTNATLGISCTNYQVIVDALSTVAVNMPVNRNQELGAVLVAYLKQSIQQINQTGCRVNNQTDADWLTVNLGHFSSYLSFSQLAQFNISWFGSLDLLTPSQAAELTLSSGALNSTSQIDLVFNQLQKGDAFMNVHDFLTVLSDQKAPVINPAVRDVMMNRTFKIISMKFSQFQTYDWYDWFKVKLISLLPSFTAEMLTNATLGISCTNYHVIVDALSTVAVNMPVNRNQELGAVLVAYLKQSIQQINQTGCRVNNQTDVDWLTVNLGHFSSYLSFSQLAQFNISWFGSLDLLTPSQAAELTLSSGALNSTSQIDLVFNQLQKGDAFTNVHDFLTVLSDQKAPVINPAVRDVMMNRTFKIISMKFSQFQTYDWYDWFKVKLISLLPSFTAEMLTNATLGISCTNYHVIVDALSTVAVNMPVNRNQELGAVLVAYLKQSIQQINQTGCRVNNQTDADWLTVNLGHFSSYLSFSQLAQFNISWFGSLDLLTPSQAAELTLSSGALNSTSQIDLVFNQLQKGDAFTNVHDFLTVLSDQKAPVINPAVRDVMMNRTFKIISMKFSQFQTYDWYDWFKVKLISLLPSFTAEMLTNATLGISCTNYHVIVDALSTVAVNMPVNRNQELGAVLVAYLKQSIQQINQTGCRVNNQTDVDWLTVNLGHFSSYLSFSQLAQFNISWFGSLDLLTPSQAAELTLSSGALNSTSQIDLVFNQLQKGDAFTNVHDFLTVLSDQKAPVINPAVRDVMMNRTFKIISMKFSQFQTYDWYDWFKVKLISLLPSFTAEMLTNATLGISCTNYHVIVDALSTVAVNMPVNRNQELGAVLVAYLKQSIQQINQTGCRVNNQTDVDWLTVNLGHFSSYLSFSQLAQFNISWFGSLDLLTPSQAAELTLSSGALNSTSQIDLVFNQLQKGDAFTNVHDFLTVLSDQKAPVINPAVRDVMMNRTFKIISMKFSQFQTYDWYDWFKVKLISLLPSFTAEMLTNATLGISCTNYHVIVDALSTVAVNMPVNRNQELGAVLVAYLKQSIQQINQTGCRVNNQTDADWLTVNLGHFSSYLSFSQLAQFNISWFGSLDLLTPSQAAELTLSSGALNSTSQIDLVFNQLQKGDAFTNVHDFLTVLSDQKAPVINPAVRDVMMNRTFKIISMKFSQFQTYDWYDWFKVKLISLLPSFTAEMLTNATLGISCTNYHVIVDALSTVAVNMPVNRNQELGAVLVAYLKQSIQQINQTGCRVNNQTDADWLTVNLGHFSSYLSFSQLAQFNISWFGSLDLLTPSQAAELTLSSGALNSTSQIDLVFNQLQKGDAFMNVHDFLTVLSDQKAPVINPAVRDVMMNRTFKIISMKFSQFQTYDWYDWFKVKLISLLPSFTAEMLTNATLGISCTNYHVIVDALSTVAVNMPVNRNQELGAVLVAYLKQSIQQINQTGCRVNNQTDADWLTVNLGHFSSYLSFSQLAQFNISWFGSLDLLTPSQAAELTLSSGALNSTSQIDLVFNQLQKGDAFMNVHDFLTVLSDQKAPVINPAVRDVMMNRTFKIISMKFSQFQTYDWYDWFKVKLISLLPSFTAEMLTNATLGISCTNYHVIVDALSTVAVNMPVNRNQELGAVLVAYLKQSIQQINQTGCRVNNQTDADWLTVNLGHFSSYLSFSQLAQFNISWFGSLDLLTPSQAAELTLSSGALNSTSQIDLVFNQLQKGDAFTNVHDFLTVLSDQKAPVINPAVRDVMMNRTFKIISMKFSQFQTYDWYDWFKVKLISLLPSFTAEMLTNATLGISCTNYHVIVDALSTVAVNMPVNRNQELGAVLVAYLKQSIQQINQTGCRVNNQTDADWLTVNLGHFSSYLSFSQLAQFNISWFGSLDLLTPSQAAELTLSSGALNSTSQIDLVFNQLQKGDAFTNVHDFLTVLSDQKAPVINPAVRDVMMNRTFKIISMKFSQFQTYDWYDWFKVKLISLLPSFTAEMLTNATLGISCTNYHVIVDALSTVAVNMPVNRNQELGAVLVAYLKQSIQQINQTGCRVNNQTDADWLTVNLGHFSSYLSFSQLAQFNISWFGSLDLLTPSQAAELTLSSGALNSTSQIDLVFNQLQKGDAFTNVHDFLTVLSDQKAPVINPAVRDVMMNRTFKIISMKFSQFQTYDWYDWFKVKLISLLPSFTAEMLTNATLGISCTNYHVIVDALSTVAVNMPVNRNQELGAVLVAYLKQSIQQINQTGCRVNNQTDADWLTVNLGHFSSYLSFSQLAQFNISWFGSLDLLTPSQAAELTLSSGALNSTSQIDLVFNQLQKGDAFTNVHEFLSVFSVQKVTDTH